MLALIVCDFGFLRYAPATPLVCKAIGGIIIAMIEVITHSPEATQDLAKTMARVLHGGEVIELISDIGGGKTTFTQGLARGLDITETVQSPTFTISRIYAASGGLELHHFDFYRLSQAGVVAAELAESLDQPNAIVVVEWGDIVHDVLPQTRLRLTIRNVDETVRRLQFVIPPAYDHVRAALAQYQEGQSVT